MVKAQTLLKMIFERGIHHLGINSNLGARISIRIRIDIAMLINAKNNIDIRVDINHIRTGIRIGDRDNIMI